MEGAAAGTPDPASRYVRCVRRGPGGCPGLASFNLTAHTLLQIFDQVKPFSKKSWKKFGGARVDPRGRVERIGGALAILCPRAIERRGLPFGARARERTIRASLAIACSARSSSHDVSARAFGCASRPAPRDASRSSAIRCTGDRARWIARGAYGRTHACWRVVYALARLGRPRARSGPPSGRSGRAR